MSKKSSTSSHLRSWKHLTNKLIELTNRCSTVLQSHPVLLSKLISVFQLVNHPSLHLPAVPDNYWPLIRWLKWKQAAVSPEGKDNELVLFQAVQFLCIMKDSIVLTVISEGLKCFSLKDPHYIEHGCSHQHRCKLTNNKQQTTNTLLKGNVAPQVKK